MELLIVQRGNRDSPAMKKWDYGVEFRILSHVSYVTVIKKVVKPYWDGFFSEMLSGSDITFSIS